jgi:transcriptional regulator with XRE-family HTH domain
MEKSEKEYILKALGEKLKELKNQQKLSYRELAAKCDIDHADLKKKRERGRH